MKLESDYKKNQFYIYIFFFVKKPAYISLFSSSGILAQLFHPAPPAHMPKPGEAKIFFCFSLEVWLSG
jgi:hypothetical protein